MISRNKNERVIYIVLSISVLVITTCTLWFSIKSFEVCLCRVMGSLGLLQYTSIISVHNINWFVFLMVTLFSVRYGLNLYVVCSVLPAVPWLRQLVAGLSPPGFDPRSVHVRCVVDRMALGQVFLPVLQFFPCKYRTTCAPHSSSSICCSLPAGRRSEAWEPSKKQFSFGNPGTLDRKVFSVLPS